jgi:hypothetical protein
MAQESEPVPLKSINIDVVEGTIILEGTDGRAIRFTPMEALQQLLNKANTPLPAPSQEPETTAESKETTGTITVSGKLKTQPKEGSPDRRGRPTATARLAYHQEGHKDAQFYFCTFHGGTRDIALTLPVESPISVLGYARPAKEEGRLDEFSVMRILKYPGQQPKRNEA